LRVQRYIFFCYNQFCTTIFFVCVINVLLQSFRNTICLCKMPL